MDRSELGIFFLRAPSCIQNIMDCLVLSRPVFTLLHVIAKRKKPFSMVAPCGVSGQCPVAGRSCPTNLPETMALVPNSFLLLLVRHLLLLAWHLLLEAPWNSSKKHLSLGLLEPLEEPIPLACQGRDSLHQVSRLKIFLARWQHSSF